MTMSFFLLNFLNPESNEESDTAQYCYAKHNSEPFVHITFLLLGVPLFVFKICVCAGSYNSYANQKNNKVLHTQSSFNGVNNIANNKTIAEIINVITTMIELMGFSEKSSNAPKAVNKYFTRSNNRSATFSFLRRYLSFNSLNITNFLVYVQLIFHSKKRLSV